MIPSPARLMADFLVDDSVTMSPAAHNEGTSDDVVVMRDRAGRWAMFSYTDDGSVCMNIFEAGEDGE